MTERRSVVTVNASWREHIMKRHIGAAVAVCALTWAGAAAADVVVFQQAGNSDDVSLWQLALPGAGNYRFDFTTSAPVYADFVAGYTYHWDTFIAPPPRPHSEFLEGNDSDLADGAHFIAATSGTWSYTIPETTYTFFNSSGLEWLGVPDGTSLYKEVRSENPYFSFFASVDYGVDPFDYTFTITRLSAVPEPATWAMMIVGFGLAGSALRHRPRPALSQS